MSPIEANDLAARSKDMFEWPDYVVFTVMNLFCISIGVYFGFIRSSKNTQEYLVGGRDMRSFPVGISLVLCYVSGISFLGTPMEIYVYGTQYVFYTIGIIFAALISQSFYLPILHNLKLTSNYEYLERRYDRRIRRIAAAFCIFGTICWLPIVIYVPALALNHVTGIGIHYVTPLVSLICIFYTTVGGFRAVIWTDSIQAMVMISSMVLVVIKGTIDIGGFQTVWDRNMASGRIETPIWDINPTTRHTMWSLVIGGGIYMIQGANLSQVMIQKYQSLPTLKAAKRATWFFVCGLITIILLCSYCGLLIYATYYDCDPLTTKVVNAKDQLLPLLVMKVLGEIPGLPGIFLAGVFSAALSSLASGLNSLSAVFLEDLYKPCFRKMSQRHEKIILKCVTTLFGCVAVGLAFIVEKLGSVLQLTLSVDAVTCGPLLGLFTMGIFLPWVKTMAASIGGFCGLVIMAWISLSTQVALGDGSLTFPTKPVSIDGCHGNITLISSLESTDEVFVLYRISYLWYTLFGCGITVVATLLASLCTGWNNPHDIDPILISPLVKKYFMRKTCKQIPNYEIDPLFQEKTIKISKPL